MAAPPEVTIDDLSGKYVMNSTLSDSPDPILTLQGLSWFLRKAISLATVTITVTQYTDKTADNKDDDKGVLHIDFVSVATGGISTTYENRILDWTDRFHVDKIFGPVLGRSRVVTFAAGSGGEGFEMAGPGGEDDKKFLLGLVDKDGETAPESEAGWCNESAGRHVQSFVVQATEGGERVQDGWSAEQVWGFEVIGGSRYWTRRVVCRKGEEGVARARLVYDYKGKA